MDKQCYYAKSALSNGSQPTVKDHLNFVAKLALEFGDSIGLSPEAGLAGQFHDFGKYSDDFQKVLLGTAHNRDHAVSGAAVLYANCGKKHAAYRPVIEAINGHHDGLQEYGVIESMLKECLSSDEPHIGNNGKQVTLNGNNEFAAAYRRFRTDFPNYTAPRLQPLLPKDADNVENMLYTRMLFSCLVDADYSVSASDEQPDYLQTSGQYGFDPARYLDKLYARMEKIRADSKSANEVNLLREELFEQCGKMGECPEGLFTLTAPTGTGKTLALLHFALRHCAATGKRRIIIVLPFLTLAEQNTDTYSKIMPDILVDHSQSQLPDAARDFAARWSVPVIITTTVKFFESLFARQPTDCRKLHHIANSIILFDEAQSLPPEVTDCTLRAMQELCRRYHCTMVLSTATQPDFSARIEDWQPTEILPDNRRMYRALRRVRMDWRLDEATSLDAIAEEMSEKTSVCAIVNLRRHARKLYNLLKERCSEEELFFLTTDLCASHRSEIVGQIKARLKVKLPCRVVATQCIEAGVDLDFDAMYRALAPLDSIIQAAGRCNRNGKLPELGLVTVFIPDEESPLYPGNWYQNAAEIVLRLSKRHEIDINNPDHIQEYYQTLFADAHDKPRLTKAIEHRSFEETEKEYKLIENRGCQVIVPYAVQAELYDEAVHEIQSIKYAITPKLMKITAPITVTVSFKHMEALEKLAERLNYARRHGEDPVPSSYYLLRPQYRALYTDKMGLQFPESEEFSGIW